MLKYCKSAVSLCSYTTCRQIAHQSAQLLLNKSRRQGPWRVCVGRRRLSFWDPAVQSYVVRLRAELSRLQAGPVPHARTQRSRLSRQLDLADDLQQTADDLRQLQLMLDEEDLEQLARQELKQLETAQLHMQQQFFDEVCEDEDDDCAAVIVEVSSGAGGQEAMLFASELLQMYQQYAAVQRWPVDEMSRDVTELGGLRHAALRIGSGGAYARLRHEAGVHRVQRVPRTERQGRIHTSTAAVAVLPVPELTAVQISASDVRVDTMRASGAGGQHVNTTDSAVRVTHVPSGLVVCCQQSRSQHKNRQMALDTLHARLYQAQLSDKLQATSSARKLQVGSMERSEKIRTYNFQQDRVTDHRIGGATHGVQAVLAGQKLDGIIDALLRHSRQQRILQVIQLEAVS